MTATTHSSLFPRTREWGGGPLSAAEWWRGQLRQHTHVDQSLGDRVAHHVRCGNANDPQGEFAHVFVAAFVVLRLVGEVMDHPVDLDYEFRCRTVEIR